MNILVKSFEDLNTNELYDLLQLRSEIFVVEQDCVYQDIDGKDDKALHILGYVDGVLAAYTRCFAPGDYFKQASIGRVVVRQSFRGKDYGHEIMKASMFAIQEHFHTSEIKLSAQTYLKAFYESHGFHCVGEGYLEDGIPHIGMIKNAQ